MVHFVLFLIIIGLLLFLSTSRSLAVQACSVLFFSCSFREIQETDEEPTIYSSEECENGFIAAGDVDSRETRLAE